MAHESWATTSSASTMELPTRPPTGLLFRDSVKGDKSRSWAKRISTFSRRSGRVGPPTPAAVDLEAARNADANTWEPFDEPGDHLRSPPRQEHPMPVLPEAEEDAYWRDGLRDWIAAQPPLVEGDQPATTLPIPGPQPFDQPSALTPSPIGLGISLPPGVHFATPPYPTYHEDMTGIPTRPMYAGTITSSAIESIYDAYTEAARPPYQPDGSTGRRCTHLRCSGAPQSHRTDLPSASSTASSVADFEKTNISPPSHPATGLNAIPIATSRGLSDLEKLNIRGFPSPGPSSDEHSDTAAAPRSTVHITSKSKLCQARLYRRRRRRLVIITLSVLALVCMLSGVVAALVTAGRKDIDTDAARKEVGFGVSFV
ncbi:hypothetical protein CLAFUW4_03369 [Fulvia fulva]|uniref:Transmembrane protein n=1 Tax=Passalora fulva TaxID=5499 RepID=A0A9Q8LAM5_PASFU|nr:uncharacterized protein CLAFUR5_03349 [Fulvia fulva]KAK4631974.1 hypothetical protein CLAFUR4_03358 [Fulvia fulva]KAK4633933.1 hypothetical protein CLAFUR0_03363 [Fulvia fulva]UJO13872.1 hypothetical protein CLAFUR5_03349 [Fulvia fulva]WPV11293.1 hypothetical protein CLAFUW4_03369 [Fulvia fulva]WPV26872.1 hypothetical protein CLAFUW7_03361 [Fulvia fulva]